MSIESAPGQPCLFTTNTTENDLIPKSEDQELFESMVTAVARQLTEEARTKKFKSTTIFEKRVKIVVREQCLRFGIETPEIDAETPFLESQGFPDIPIFEFGIEVKCTEADSWRCVGNSISEGHRDEQIKHIYIIYGKMGGDPEVAWRKYEDCLVHIRTSHRPRFEIDMANSEPYLFSTMGVTYDEFRLLSMEDKMVSVRKYGEAHRERTGEYLWWLEKPLTIQQHIKEIFKLAVSGSGPVKDILISNDGTWQFI